ncbi:translin-associated protein X [Neodiprion virginianus]|uniref:translin-associated protein X n=1 Tax=Neodiprion virginianus TaxID=2961670 RepID=UPI001EE76A04|nr:translin-associated protein X [Neodiprion virginianus]
MSHSRGGSGGGRRNRGQYFGHKNSKILVGDKGREVLENINENSLVIKQFRVYAAELDSKHDRYEAVVKLSRDITIESKRIIFLLHTFDKESKRDAVLGEAKTRLDVLAKTLFKSIAQELDGQNPFQYLRAYTAGIQEYIEAVTFYQYLESNKLDDWKDLERSLIYVVPCEIKSTPWDRALEPAAYTSREIRTMLTPHEYILGIADLTGELMRKCISNLGSGDIASCFQTCNFVRSIYIGFLGCVGSSGKEINRKLYTLKQSLIKMENVCYTVKVRGSEIPKHMLADVAIGASNEYAAEDDEGYHPF